MKSAFVFDQLRTVLRLRSVGAQETSSIEKHLAEHILHPLQTFLERPSKGFRERLFRIGLGAGVCNRVEAELTVCAQSMESIHAASLIIDDIEDRSEMRRGVPTLHRILGMPRALNAGNWLYFQPMHAIESLGLPQAMERLLIRAFHETLMRAHLGQSLDLGVSVDSLPRSEVSAVVLGCMELKSGALAALALSSGAVLAESAPADVEILDRWGHAFGMTLQMFDDIGNLRPGPKQFEDLRNRRPGWMWAVLSKHADSSTWDAFRDRVRSISENDALEQWFRQGPWLEKAKHEALDFFEDALAVSEGTGVSQQLLSVRTKLLELGRELIGAYG